jgi:hypothetical protein
MRMYKLSIALLYASLSHFAAGFQQLPVVDLGYSIHQATINVRILILYFAVHFLTMKQSSGQNTYLNFSNIRFGQSPTGPLRFSVPLAPEGRNTTINNGQQGVICPQGDPGTHIISLSECI